MPWIIWDEPKRIIYLENEAAPLMKYADYEEYDYVNEAVNIVDIIRDMDDDDIYAEAIRACCEDTVAYVKDHFRNVLEYQVWDSEYRSANALFLEITDIVQEILEERGMAKRKLVPLMVNEMGRRNVNENDCM